MPGAAENQTRFGDEQKFYAQPPSSVESKDSLWHPEMSRVRLLLNNKDTEMEEKVKKAVKRWNTSVRSIIRDETGLKISSTEDQKSVKIKVVDGMPQNLSDILKDIDEEILWLLLHKDLLVQTGKGLNLLQDKCPYICSQLKEVDDDLYQHALEQSRDFNTRLLDELEKWQILKRFKEIQEDVLGAYFFRISEIRLYWMAIGLMALLMGVSVESLTVVVLIHELAHAYHHIGMDIDKRRWRTNHFADASNYIVEGLAQHYTGLICEKMANKYFEASIAFNEFFKHQSGPYVDFVNWLKPGEKFGEAVRATMLDTRQKGIQDYSDFKNILEYQKKHFLNEKKLR